MEGLAQKVLERIRSFKDPVTKTPTLLAEAKIEVAETSPGTIKITFTPTNPLSPTALALAEATKTIAQKVEGVKKVTIECKNHILAERINKTLNP